MNFEHLSDIVYNCVEWLTIGSWLFQLFEILGTLIDVVHALHRQYWFDRIANVNTFVDRAIERRFVNPILFPTRLRNNRSVVVRNWCTLQKLADLCGDIQANRFNLCLTMQHSSLVIQHRTTNRNINKEGLCENQLNHNSLWMLSIGFLFRS